MNLSSITTAFVEIQATTNATEEVRDLDGTAIAETPDSTDRLSDPQANTEKPPNTEKPLSPPFANPETNCSTVSGIPQSECETLVALYNNTNGPIWNDSPDNKWNQTNTPCSWIGVECSGKSVHKIDRSGKNLTGVIPD